MTSLVGIRVLKAHTDAVKAALPEASLAVKEGGLDKFAEVIASAVVSAEDGNKTRYVVCVRTPTNELMVFGPYATFAAGKKAIDSGDLGVSKDSRGGIFPLIPAPKVTRTTKKKKDKE